MRVSISGLLLTMTLGLATTAQSQVINWDFNADDGFWTQETVVGSVPWTWNSGLGAWEVGTTTNIAHSRLISPEVTATGFLGFVTFWHSYNFEQSSGGCFDGGSVSYRMNGGSWSQLDFLGYAGTIGNNFGNPLAGREGYCGTTFGFSVPAISGGFTSPGATYQLAFDAGWDSSVGRQGANWRIYEVNAYGFEGGDLSTVPEPASMALMATGLVGLGLAARRRRKQQ